MGMRGLGQIAELCAIARPDVGVITSIGPVHLELLGTVEKRRGGEGRGRRRRCPQGGTAIVPDEPLLEPFLDRDDIEIHRFGPENVESFERIDGGSRVVFVLDGERLELEFPFTARHQAQNAVAALLAVRALGLPLPEGRVEVELSRWRGEESPLPGGGLLINDSYNANPASMRAALEHLAEHEGRKVAVLGDMAELGPTAPEYHREVGELVQSLGIDAVLGVGELARDYGGEHARRRGRGRREGDGARPAGRRRPRQGLARGRPRGRRGSAHGSPRLVERVLAAAIFAMAISILAGPKFIDFLRRNEFGQHIREEGPAGHHLKQGTPTMGGLLIVVSMIIPFLALSRLHAGRADRLLRHARLRRRSASPTTGSRSGTAARSASTAAGSSSCSRRSPPASAGRCNDIGLSTDVYAPVLDWRIGLSFGFYVLLFLIIAGAANGANLTDGIDGLAVGVGMIALITFTAMNVVTWIRSATRDRASRRLRARPRASSARRSRAARSASSGTTPFPPR